MDTEKALKELGDLTKKLGLVQDEVREIMAREELRYQAFHGLIDDVRQFLSRIEFEAGTVQAAAREPILQLAKQVRDAIDARFNAYIQAKDQRLAPGNPMNPDSWHDAEGNQLYLIQDGRSFVGNDVLWWRPEAAGYTCQIEEAGLFDATYCQGLRESDIVRLPQDVIPVVTRVVDMQRLRGMKRPDLRQPSAQTIVEKAAEVFTVKMTTDSLRGFASYVNAARTQEPPFSFVADIPKVLSDILSSNMETRGWGKLIYDKDDKSFWLGDGIGVRMSLHYPRLSRAIGLAIKYVELCATEEWIAKVLDGNRDQPQICQLTQELGGAFHEILHPVVALGWPVRLEAVGGKVRIFDNEVNSVNLSGVALGDFLKVIAKFKAHILEGKS